MARGSLIASLALHDRTDDGCEENGAQWIVDVDPADDRVAADPIESGDVSAPVEQSPERRSAKVLPVDARLEIPVRFALS